MSVEGSGDGNHPPVGRPLSVRDILTLYLRHSRAEVVHGAAALADRERTFALFAAVCGDLAVTDCKPYHLTDFIEARAGWRSVSTRRAKAAEIRAAFQWATDQERINRNPFRGVRYREADRRPDMPDDVLNRALEAGNRPWAKAVLFLRLTGCRTGELCAARWEDVDLDRGVWVIPKHKTRKHTGKPKVVALVPEAVALLRRLLEMAPATAPGAVPTVADSAVPGNFVFRNNRGKPWTRGQLYQTWRRMRIKGVVKSNATLHGIRHRFGSAGVANGAPIKLVSMQLGHASVATTEKYYVCLDGEIEAMREAARKAAPK